MLNVLAPSVFRYVRVSYTFVDDDTTVSFKSKLKILPNMCVYCAKTVQNAWIIIYILIYVPFGTNS